MQSASCMTVYRRVDCKRPGCPPDTFTMPVMERSPIAGNFFFLFFCPFQQPFNLRRSSVLSRQPLLSAVVYKNISPHPLRLKSILFPICVILIFFRHIFISLFFSLFFSCNQYAEKTPPPIIFAEFFLYISLFIPKKCNSLTKRLADFRKSFSFIQTLTSINSVPETIRRSPKNAFTESFSPKTKYENATVTSMLSLSIGTTTLASPSCNAL